MYNIMNINIIAIITIIVLTIYISKESLIKPVNNKPIRIHSNKEDNLDVQPIIYIYQYNKLPSTINDVNNIEGSNKYTNVMDINNFSKENSYVNNYMENQLDYMYNQQNMTNQVINYNKRNPLYLSNYEFDNNLHTTYIYHDDKSMNNNSKLHSINQLYDLGYGVPNKMGNIINDNYSPCPLNKYIYN